MTTRTRNLILFGGAALIAISFVASSILKSTGTRAASEYVPSPVPSEETPTEAGSSAPTAPASNDLDAPNTTQRREYAIALAELHGLPSDAPPGTKLDLWVAWDPPLTEQPKVQRLLRDVILTRIVPALTPDGPDAALLSVPINRLSQLIWADRYGAIAVSVVAVPGSPTG